MKWMVSMRRLLAVAVLGTAVVAHAGTMADLWYDPQQSGWGVSLVDQGETSFVTVFGYGADGSAVWYAAPQARLVAVTGATGLPSYTGALYRYRGPASTAVFDPSLVRPTEVGQLRVDPISTDRIRLQYDVDGMRVDRELVRLTWAPAPIAPFYVGNFSLHQLAADGRDVGTLSLQADMLFIVQDGIAELRADDQLGRRCDYRGPYVQAGKLGRFAGSFDCSAGRDGVMPTSGTFQASEIEATANGVTGRLHTVSASQAEDGRFGGIKP